MKNEKKFKGVYLDAKTGTYYVSTTFTTQDGFEVKKCKRGFSTQREANLWKEQQRVFYANNCIDSCGVVKTPTEVLIDRYVEQRKKNSKANTINIIKCYLNRYFGAFFKTKKLADLKPKDINDYYLFILDQKVKNQTKNTIITDSLLFTDWLDLMEYITPTIARKFKLILVKLEITEAPVNNYLEREEIKMLLETYDGITRNDKMQKLLCTAFIYSGLRHSEMLALTYQDIDFNKQTINVCKQVIDINGKVTIQNSTKTNKNKTVDIPLFLVELFQELEQVDHAKKTDFIFIGKKGKLVTRKQSLDCLRKHLKMANLKNICVHDLRHTYTSMLFENGNFEEKYISKQLGHSNTSTTHNVYEHLTNNRRANNKKNIDNL